MLDASLQIHWRAAVVLRIVLLTSCGFCSLDTDQAVFAAAFQLDDFESETLEGWSGASSLAVENDGGPDGTGDAFLHVTSTGFIGQGSRLATYNSSSNWIGDLGALGAASVEVDLMSPADSKSLEMRLVLFGPVSVPNFNNQWTSTVAASVPNDGIWRTYNFSLAEVDLTRVEGSSTYASMLTDVQRIMFRHDAGTPSDSGTTIAADLGIDNVRFVPAVLLGDMNQDGNLSLDDIPLFVEALTNPLAYAARELPLPAATVGDVNQDERFDLGDNLAFSALFDNSPTADAESVPEASTISMTVLILLFQVIHRRRSKQVLSSTPCGSRICGDPVPTVLLPFTK